MARKTSPMVTYGRTTSEALGSSPELPLEVLDSAGMPMLLLDRGKGGNPFHDKLGRFAKKPGSGFVDKDVDFVSEDSDVDDLLEELLGLGEVSEPQVSEAQLLASTRPSLDERAEPQGTVIHGVPVENDERAHRNTITLKSSNANAEEAATALGVTVPELLSMFDSKVLEQERIDVDVSVRATSSASGRTSVKIRASLSIGDRPVAQLTRNVDPNRGEVDHEFFDIDADFQAQGISKDLFRSHVKLYDKMGLKAVKVLANAETGGYAWARYGFDASEKNVNRYRADLLREAQNKMASPGEIKMIEAIEHMWEIAAFRSNNGLVSGKSVLLGQAWGGHLDLTQGSEGRRQLERYLEIEGR